MVNFTTQMILAIQAALVSLKYESQTQELVVELIREHEYLFTQIKSYSQNATISKLAERFRKRLGPLWKEHVRLAECLWDGPVLAWLKQNSIELEKAIAAAEEAIVSCRPEESCPIDGSAIINRYQLLAGPWVRIMKIEIGQWCINNPHLISEPSAVLDSADSIFQYYRISNPYFNSALHFLRSDSDVNVYYSDPLSLLKLLKQASMLKFSEVANWARGYRRKAIRSIVTMLAKSYSSNISINDVLEYIDSVVKCLPDVTLGELFSMQMPPARIPSDAVLRITRNRDALSKARNTYNGNLGFESHYQYARALRDCGWYDESKSELQQIIDHYGCDQIDMRFSNMLDDLCSNPDAVG